MPHTNDLTALALTHSALHEIVTPQIYSRFDIVWPDTTGSSEPRSGVDALTYGLSTLVMAPDVFQGLSAIASSGIKRRRGNDFAKYTRKFSLGNGPAEWVSEYMISKESGKMLGTLVTLAVARMVNLEAFVWDMPTGIVRDVWEALSSLGDGIDGPPRLRSVWVRCHSAKHARASSSQYAHSHYVPAAYGSGHAAPPPHHHHHHHHLHHHNHHHHTSHAANSSRDSELSSLQKSYRRIEHPNFSVLPPLEKIAALDIDELAYLEELSVLVEKSADGLRELRLSVAHSVDPKAWFPPDQKDPALSHGLAGGILGLALKRLYDCRPSTRHLDGANRSAKAPQQNAKFEAISVQTEGIEQTGTQAGSSQAAKIPVGKSSASSGGKQKASSQAEAGGSSHHPTPIGDLSTANPYGILRADGNPSSAQVESASQAASTSSSNNRSRGSSQAKARKASKLRSARHSKRRKLHLDVLELSNTPLFNAVLLKTIDWTRLTALTLLNCNHHEELWKALRRIHAPEPPSVGPSSADARRHSLRLTRIRTNGVTPALLAVLKETLAPNTLEWLFLHDRPSPGGSSHAAPPVASVAVDHIFRAALRRHRASLAKLLLDSGAGAPAPGGLRGRESTRWRRWMLPRAVLAFVTSGKMRALRELSASLDYEDWHFFLQRLPRVPHLRSLHVPHLHRATVGGPAAAAAGAPDARDLALQVVDIVALRPEVELCYLGLLNKCFEVLEVAPHAEPSRGSAVVAGAVAAGPPGWTPMPDSDSEGGSVADPVDEDDDDDDEDGDDDPDANDDGDGYDGTVVVVDEDEAGVGGGGDEASELTDDDEEAEGNKVQYQLREILFYSEKVEIFRVRHAML